MKDAGKNFVENVMPKFIAATKKLIAKGGAGAEKVITGIVGTLKKFGSGAVKVYFLVVSHNSIRECVHPSVGPSISPSGCRLVSPEHFFLGGKKPVCRSHAVLDYSYKNLRCKTFVTDRWMD